MSKTSFNELRLVGVSRTFDESVALSNLSLTIANGEFIALLGPSGCGKSTALNCIAGLLSQTSGSIFLDGKRIDSLPPERRGFGMVFQNYALFPHLTVRNNIAFGLKIRRTKKAEVRKRVDAALALVRLQPHADKFPAQLSGGQQQRVAIARAVVLEPQVVLMDEPLSNLDAKLRNEMRGEIRKLHKTLGLTSIYVTHDQEEAMSLADRVVVMHDGVVQQVGTPEDVYLQPANAFVADFMGYRNLLQMTLKKSSTKAGAITSEKIKLSSSNLAAKTTNGAVTVAIRPDDFTVKATRGNQIRTIISSVEYQGKDFGVEATCEDGTQLFIRTEEKLKIGQKVTFGVKPERVLVFPQKKSPSHVG